MNRTPVKDVMDEGLCTGCGTCAGVCPEGLFEFELRKIEPNISKPDSCIECGQCQEFCSGQSVDFIRLNELVFGKKNSGVLGSYKEIFTGYSTDEIVRYNASAGGVVTALLLYAYDNKLVKGAVVVSSVEGKPWISKVSIATTRDEIISAKQSKYTIVPVNSIIRELRKLNGNYAIVALPCQIHSLRKMEKKDIKNNIKYMLGIYCGFSSKYGATEYIIKKIGVSDLNGIYSFEYRGKGWPGGILIKLKNGKEFFLKKFHHNFVVPLYLPGRCTLCIDLTNEFADVSIGDAWLPELIKKGEGSSLVTTRTKIGADLVEKAAKAGYLKLERKSEEDAIRAHKHMLKYKKRGAFIRMRLRELLNKGNPDYGYEIPSLTKFGYKALIVELMFVTMLWALSINSIRWLVKKMPIRLLGEMALMVRRIVTR